MGIAAVITMFTALTPVVSTVEMAIFLITLFMFAHGFWITNYITVTSEVFGKNGTSTVVGMAGTAGAIAGMLINPLIGKVVENFSYTPLWIMTGILYPLGFMVLLITIPRIRSLR
jgi:ACS family hexuronate transporter-like MFS transporter